MHQVFSLLILFHLRDTVCRCAAAAALTQRSLGLREVACDLAIHLEAGGDLADATDRALRGRVVLQEARAPAGTRRPEQLRWATSERS